jgi:hypothetical protein
VGILGHREDALFHLLFLLALEHLRDLFML